MRDSRLRWSDSLLDLAAGGPLESTLDEAIADNADALGVVSFHLRPEGGLHHLCAARVGQELTDRLNAHYLVPETNPVLPDLPALTPGRLSHIGTFSDFDAYLRSEIYAGYARPAGSHHTGLILCPARVGMYLLGIGQKVGTAWMGQGAERLYGHRLMQVARALEIAADRTIGERLKADEDAGGRSVRGLLLDQRGAPLGATLGQERVLRELCVLRPGGALTWPKGAVATWISCALGDALDGKETRTVLTFAGRRHVAYVGPGPALPFGPTCLLSLVAIGPTPWTTLSLQREIGLTPRESEVTLGLLEGSTVVAIANDLGIGVRSVRVYLGRVFDKTGARSQAQLVALLSTEVES